MTASDCMNAIFELGGALVLTLNVRRLWRDRALAGVSIVPTVWFSAWGIWNIWFYLHLGQLLSWCAGLAVVAVNTTWAVLAIWFSRRARS